MIENHDFVQHGSLYAIPDQKFLLDMPLIVVSVKNKEISLAAPSALSIAWLVVSKP